MGLWFKVSRVFLASALFVATSYLSDSYLSEAIAQTQTPPASEPYEQSVVIPLDSLQEAFAGYGNRSPLTVPFQLSDGRTISVSFEQTEVMAPGAPVVVETAQGRQNLSPAIVHFKSVEGSESNARLSLFHDQALNIVTLTGLLEIDGELQSLENLSIPFGRFAQGLGSATLVSEPLDASELPGGGNSCADLIAPPEPVGTTIQSSVEREGGGYGSRTVLYRNVSLLAIADTEYVAARGSAANAVARIQSTINLVNGIFDAQLHLRLSFSALRVYEAADPFDSNLPPFDEISRHLRSGAEVGTGYDVVQLFTGRGLQSGNAVGLAYMGGACNFNAASAVVNINNTASRTTLSAHELGHLLGAGHDSQIMDAFLTSSQDFTNLSISQMFLTAGCFQPITDNAASPLGIGSVSYYQPTVDQLHLYWNAPAGGGPSTGYEIYRSQTEFGCTGAPRAQVGSERFIDTVSQGTLYYYSFRPISPQGAGPCSNLQVPVPNFQILSVSEPSPTDYQNVSLTVNTSDGTPVSDFTTLQVFRSTSNVGCSGAPVTTINNPTGFMDVSAPISGYGVPQYFSVRGISLGTVGACSAPMALERPAPVIADATQGLHADRIEITWSQSERARVYLVYRFEVGQPSTQVTLGSTTNRSMTDTSANADGRRYHYFVQSCNASGCRDSAYALGYRNAIPTPPTNLQASDGTSTNSIALTWAAPLNGRVTGYRVYRSVTGAAGQFTLIAQPTTSYVDSSADIQFGYPVFYRVTAVSALGEGAPSAADSGYVSVPLPGAVSISSITEPNPSNFTTVTINWTNTAGTESFFDVYRDTSSSSACAGNFIYRTGAQQGTYSIPVAVPQYGVQYYYTIRALNGAGAGPCSAPVSIAPPSPAPLTATRGTVANAVQLSWTTFSTSRQWIIERRLADSSGAFSALQTIGATPMTYTDSSAASDGTHYTYQVLGCNVSGCTPSNLTNGWRPAAPSAPRTLEATDSSVLNAVDLTWGHPIRGTVDSYRIEYAASAAGPFSLAGNAAAAANTFRFQNSAQLQYGDVRYFRVIALSTLGDSNPSNVDAGAALVQVPNVPSITGIVEQSGSLRVTWNGGGGAAGRFTVYRNTTLVSCTGAVIAQNIEALTFTDSSFVYGVPHYYSVRAFNVAGSSACSSVSSLALPTNSLTSAGDGGNSSYVMVSFTGGLGRAYNSIRRSDSGEPGTFTEIQQTTAGAAFADFTAPANGAHRWYMAVPCNASGCSSSNVDVGYRAAPPSAPTNVVASDGDFADRVRVTWSPSALGSVNSYFVQRSTSSNGAFQFLGSVPAAGPYIFDDLSAGGGSVGNVYFYRVTAQTSYPPSAASAADSGFARQESSSSSSMSSSLSSNSSSSSSSSLSSSASSSSAQSSSSSVSSSMSSSASSSSASSSSQSSSSSSSQASSASSSSSSSAQSSSSSSSSATSSSQSSSSASSSASSSSQTSSSSSSSSSSPSSSSPSSSSNSSSSNSSSSSSLSSLSSSSSSSATSSSLSSSSSDSSNSSNSSSDSSSSSDASVSSSDGSSSASSSNSSQSSSASPGTPLGEENSLGGGTPQIPLGMALTGKVSISRPKASKQPALTVSFAAMLKDAASNPLPIASQAQCRYDFMLQKNPRVNRFVRLGGFPVTTAISKRTLKLRVSRTPVAIVRQARSKSVILPVLTCAPSNERFVGKAVKLTIPKKFSGLLTEKSLLNALKKMLRK